jgi:hypothetical protein
MLGEQFYEQKGKIIGHRVLDVNGEEGPKIETTFSADVKIKGTISVNELGTCKAWWDTPWSGPRSVYYKG